MRDLALLTLRLTTGSLLAGHGAQKLFGWFGGHGLRGTSDWLESMDLRPGRPWALAAGIAEFGGGLLTLLGLFNPLGPIGVTASMTMATVKAHWGKPIWVTSGGAELPVTNLAVMAALMLDGPGKYSLDNVMDTWLPRWSALPALAGVAAIIALGLQQGQAVPAASEQESEAEMTAAGDRSRGDGMQA